MRLLHDKVVHDGWCSGDYSTQCRLAQVPKGPPLTPDPCAKTNIFHNKKLYTYPPPKLTPDRPCPIQRPFVLHKSIPLNNNINPSPCTINGYSLHVWSSHLELPPNSKYNEIIQVIKHIDPLAYKTHMFSLSDTNHDNKTPLLQVILNIITPTITHI
jgi:hypothetical protein